jgi:hypothetical protein
MLPLNVNIQVVPGYDYGLRVTPSESGDFRIVCNEFCGINHHVMVGRVIVEDAPAGPGGAGVAGVAGGAGVSGVAGSSSQPGGGAQ